MRDVFMDYIKPLALRLALQIFTIVWLVALAPAGRSRSCGESDPDMAYTSSSISHAQVRRRHRRRRRLRHARLAASWRCAA
jgi:hypothetical protein